MKEVTLRALRRHIGKLRLLEDNFTMIEIEAGCIVESLRGRDAGRLFLVLRTDGEYAHITDGQIRKIDKPKLKKLKHLKLLGIKKDAKIYDKIVSGKSITDAEIRKLINLFSSEEVQ